MENTGSYLFAIPELLPLLFSYLVNTNYLSFTADHKYAFGKGEKWSVIRVYDGVHVRRK